MTNSVGERLDVVPLPPDFPPVVYVPCAERVVNPEDVRIEFRQTREGKTAMLAYSALDRLHTCCGVGQPWFVIPTAGLEKLHSVQPFDLVLLDLVIPEGHRTHEGER